MQQLLNSGLSSNQVLAALNNQFLANAAAAQNGLQMAAHSGLIGQSVIRRAGKANVSAAVESPISKLPKAKHEESDDEDAESGVSENGGDEKDEDRDSDRGPTIAQLTSPGVIKSTKSTEEIFDAAIHCTVQCTSYRCRC